jgi:hypothetical protein
MWVPKNTTYYGTWFNTTQTLSQSASNGTERVLGLEADFGERANEDDHL